jgi:hypothetical protein
MPSPLPAPPTLVSTARSTQTLGNETRRARDVSPALAQLEPDAGPLTTFMAKTRSKASTDPKFEWFENQLLPRFDVLAGNMAAGDLTMTVTNYAFFRGGDLVRINKKEIVLVTATPTTTSVAIQRAFGETAAQAPNSGVQLHIVGNTNQEGAKKRSLLSTQRVPQFNYTGIIRDPFGVTKTAIATKTFAGEDFTEEEATQLIEHKKHVELQMLMGERYEDLTQIAPQRSSRGIRNWMYSNIKYVNGALTEPTVDSHLRVSYRYGQKVKLGLLAPIAAQAFNGFAKDKLRVMDMAKTYGVSMSRYENAGRVLLLTEHVLMTNDDLNDFSGIAGEAYIVDIEDVQMRFVNGRLTVHNQNIQDPDQDQRIDEYLSEVGLEVRLERKHGMFLGING